MSGYQRALITGASSGLGREMAKWFAARGATVYAAGRRADELERLAADSKGRIVPFPLDVSNADACAEAVRRLDEESGGLDLIIANAGVGDGMKGAELEWSRVRKVLDVNVMGAVATLCGGIPGMVKRGRGHLVGISSVAAFLQSPKFGTYNASKTFLTAWLDNVRFDVAPLGLTVTAIHPGYVRTEMTAKNGAMPFVLEADDAAARMGKAIEARRDRLSYPWPTAFAVWLLSRLPTPLRRFIARRAV